VRNPIIRDAYSSPLEKVPFAGLIAENSPPSGVYGGASVVWMPTEKSSILCLVVGTQGIAPDEALLTRAGHRRRVAALRSLLRSRDVTIWTKPDPALLDFDVPKAVRDDLPDFKDAFDRYGRCMYCVARVPEDLALARKTVQGFFDLYAHERGWKLLASYQPEFDEFIHNLNRHAFPSVSAEQVNELLRERRFVILQGPPGTGKSYLAQQVKDSFFDGRGQVVQFHPSVTYEDFVVGLSPDTKQEGTLRFDVRPGWLVTAALEARQKPYLLVIDEINRADLSKTLGEAIYLFEASEIGDGKSRKVRLPHAIDGQHEFSLPENLYVLGTMNTADRSITSVDLAVRRRFAFLRMLPRLDVVESENRDSETRELAVKVFNRILGVFVEHAPDEVLELIPGHSYFLAANKDHLLRRFRYELIPLLDEYLRAGYLGPATIELQAVRDWIEDLTW
jgi:5-methylcytosine-specific restriction protein B